MKFTPVPTEGAGPHEIALAAHLAKTDATMGSVTYRPGSTREQVAKALLGVESAISNGDFKYIAFDENDRVIEFADEAAHDDYMRQYRLRKKDEKK